MMMIMGRSNEHGQRALRIVDRGLRHASLGDRRLVCGAIFAVNKGVAPR